MMTPAIPLSELPMGRSATVVRFPSNNGSRRFVEMGLIPGVEVTAIRVAPLGDPVQFAVMGSRISIRRADADAIMVRVNDR
jgi:Fe2+ transport system protein FeoA